MVQTNDWPCSYNYWEKCSWDEVLTPEFVAQAPLQVQRVFETVTRLPSYSGFVLR
jgi:hypothetical protein